MEKIRLMVADDNREFCKLIRDYVQMIDDVEFVGAAFDGYSALDMIKTKMPDVILLDNVMPHLDGIGVLTHLRAIPKSERPKIVTVTACPTDIFMENACKLGASYAMSRKMDIVEMINRCRMVCSTSSGNYAKASESASVENSIASLLREMGISANIKGYKYLKYSVPLMLEDEKYKNSLTKELYPAVAEYFNVSPASVERAIRSAIGMAWKRGNPEFLNSIFASSVNPEKGRPTNSEFLAVIADKLSIEMRRM